MPYSLRSKITGLVYKGILSKEEGTRIRGALGKQKPKKPIHDSFYFHCPICNGIVYKGRGCANNECRQKIDWSGNND